MLQDQLNMALKNIPVLNASNPKKIKSSNNSTNPTEPKGMDSLPSTTYLEIIEEKNAAVVGPENSSSQNAHAPNVTE